MGRLVAVSLMSMAIPAFAVAQHRGAAPAAISAPSHHAPAASHLPSTLIHATQRPKGGAQAAVRVGAPVVSRRTGIRTTHQGNGVPFNFGQTDFQDVPGLGFDFPHLAAISGNRRIHSRRFAGGVPFGFNGFLLTPPVIVEEVQPGEPQQAAPEEESAAENAADPERPRRSRSSQIISEAQQLGPPAPQRDVEEYVFVRRDGELLFAVAYSWENGTLRYVTPDGLRRSVAGDLLDLGATQQFNEQRGLSFRSPA